MKLSRTFWIEHKLAVFAVILLVTGIGVYLLTGAHASSPYAAQEAESGSLASGAILQTGSSASGNQYVQFNGTQFTGTPYYVDCTNGNDSANGTSPGTAWQTITQANKATLQPGDALLLKRGCTFPTQLTAKWTGSATAPITIDAYGSGANPIIKSSVISDVQVTGNYITIQDISTTFDVPTTTADYSGCQQPIATTYGINFVSGSHNIVQDSDISHAMDGVHFGSNASGNSALHNKIHDNDIMQDGTGTLGAWGVLVDGDDNDIGWNEIYDNVAACPYPGLGYGSNSVELYTAQNNRIEHNYAHGDRVFSELGSSSTKASSGNVYSYNVFVSAIDRSRFITTRGSGDPYGPVNNTTAEHNTIYVTSTTDSQGIVCTKCGTGILTVNDNIIWANTKALFIDGSFNQSGNLYWSSDGTPSFQGFTPAAQWIVNPLFVNAANNNFQLQAGSPAIDAGGPVTFYNTDIANTSLPVGSATDLGAYEYAP